MAEDTLLSELCTICHTNPPKYRCPRCAVRTCSLPCTRKHKTWSQCSGVRDPAAYRTRAQLQDPASFDRDFNFITSIERGLERAEREADRRGIELEHDYMLAPASTAGTSAAAAGITSSQRLQIKKNKRKREVGSGGAQKSPFVRAAEAAGVHLVRAPRGLTRFKANHSRVHPKHKCLNWSVEWIVALTGQSIIRPCLESTPLREAYDRVFPYSKNDEKKETTAKSNEELPAAGVSAHRNVYFYLHRQRTAASKPVLAPLRPAATLREVLRGRTVIEFPTVYVLQDVLKGGGEGPFVLEEEYLRDHPDEAGPDVEEQEDYTSSEGSSSSDSSSDDDDGNEGDGDDDNGNDRAGDDDDGKNELKMPSSS